METTENNPNSTTNSTERIIAKLLDNPAVSKLIEQLGQQFAAESTRQTGFWVFLKSIDIAQKIYNILLIIIVFIGVIVMKQYEAINNDAAQTILAMVIGAGLSNAIRDFFSSRKR